MAMKLEGPKTLYIYVDSLVPHWACWDGPSREALPTFTMHSRAAQPWADHKRKINTKAQLTNPTCIYGLYVSVSTDFFLTARVKKVALFLESVKAYCVVFNHSNRPAYTCA